MRINPKFISNSMTTDEELSGKVDKISPIQAGEYRNPVFTVNEQGQITSIREKITSFIDKNVDETNNTTNFATYISLTINAVESSNYRIEFMAMYRYSSRTNSPIVDVTIDGTSLYNPELASHQEVKDSADTERILKYGFDIQNLSAGSHTIELIYTGEDASGTMTMRYGSLRVSEQ